MSNKCEEIRPLLAELIYEEVDAPTAKVIYGHLEECAACRQRYAGFRNVRADLQEWQPVGVPAGTTFIGMPAVTKQVSTGSMWLRGLAVAATFIFGLVLTAAAVNLQISSAADGWTMSTSLWGRAAVSEPVAQPQLAATPEILTPADPGSTVRPVSLNDLDPQELESWLDAALTSRGMVPAAQANQVAAVPASDNLSPAQIQQVNSLMAGQFNERANEERYMFSTMLATSESRQRDAFNATLTSLYENLEAEREDALYMLVSELGFLQLDTEQRLRRNNSQIDYLMNQVNSQPETVEREERN
jgi:anti-sigma factor RsiW